MQKIQSSFLNIILSNSFYSIIKIILGVLFIKYVTSNISLKEFGEFGYLTSLFSLALILIGAGMNNALVWISSNTKIRNTYDYYSSTLLINLASSLIFISLFILSIKYLQIPDEFEITYLIILFFTVSILTSIGNNIQGILIAKDKQIKVFGIQFIQSVGIYLFSLLGLIFYGFKGFIFTYIASYSLNLCVVLLTDKVASLKYVSSIRELPKFASIKKVSSFTLMAYLSALTIPLTQFLTKDLVISEFNLEEAGLYEGSQKLSNIYTGIISAGISSFFLPIMSKNPEGSNDQFKYYYRYVMPFIFIGLLLYYVLKEYIIIIVLNDGFLKMSNNLTFIIIGDFFRIFNYFFAIWILSKKLVHQHVLTEITYVIIYIFGIMLISRLELNIDSVYILYMITNIFLFIIFSLIFKHNLNE